MILIVFRPLLFFHGVFCLLCESLLAIVGSFLTLGQIACSHWVFPSVGWILTPGGNCRLLVFRLRLCTLTSQLCVAYIEANHALHYLVIITSQQLIILSLIEKRKRPFLNAPADSSSTQRFLLEDRTRRDMSSSCVRLSAFYDDFR